MDIYERHADAWVEVRLREGSLYERGWLDRFCALVPPGGSVLDMGCGAGEPIARPLLAPPAVSVIAAAPEEQENDNDNQN